MKILILIIAHIPVYINYVLCIPVVILFVIMASIKLTGQLIVNIIGTSTLPILYLLKNKKKRKRINFKEFAVNYFHELNIKINIF